MSDNLSENAPPRRKILAVLDNSPECGRAVIYAAAQACRRKDGLILLYVIDDGDFRQLFGVERVMRAEAAENAQIAMDAAIADVRDKYHIEAEPVIREGRVIEEIAGLAERDGSIALLVLAAGSYADGPGPLIQALAGRAKHFALPVTIVPADISEELINAVA